MCKLSFLLGNIDTGSISLYNAKLLMKIYTDIYINWQMRTKHELYKMHLCKNRLDILYSKSENGRWFL